jgi:hypothetical protein
MYPIFFVILFFVLALLIPVAWSCGHVYGRVRGPKTVLCPADRNSAVLMLDAAEAVRAHLRGNEGLRICSCSQWPERLGCAQECMPELRRQWSAGSVACAGCRTVQ